MYLKSLELIGFKSFAKKDSFQFNTSISAIVGPNGSGKSNVAEAFRFVLGEQSIKSLRGKKGEDLIFNGSGSVGRANRASVKVIFDNRPSARTTRAGKRLFNIDFDEVILERAVHRDGINQYSINGSQVRLRDVLMLLSEANIGSSGYHIISQGEADRILSAHAKERRDMIEDALGLRMYQYKKRESEKKLVKTRENIKQVESLRKEIAPHLRFLKKQVEKIKKIQILRDVLKIKYLEYFKREGLYLSHKTADLKKEKKLFSEELQKIEYNVLNTKEMLENSKINNKKSKEIIALEKDITRTRLENETATRQLGRLEGEISAEQRRVENNKKRIKEQEYKMVYIADVKKMTDNVFLHLSEAGEKDNPLEIKSILTMVRDILKQFLARISEKDMFEPEDNKDEQELLKNQHATINKKLSDIVECGNTLYTQYKKLQTEIEQTKGQETMAQQTMFELITKQNELHGKITVVEHAENELVRLQKRFESELEESILLIGWELRNFAQYVVKDTEGEGIKIDTVVTEKREKQEERLRDIEKMKIRFEESESGSGEEIIKEHSDMEERDIFLCREVKDLETSAVSLQGLIVDLEKQLDTRFKDGIEKINKEFQKFFALMFGGGSASLSIIKEKIKHTTDTTILSEDTFIESEMEEHESIEEGIDITVSLPHKRIKGLVMLSGGERALTSIALLFAMSQVNPPPFLILDETDAALDEANSKRYGDMIETLSQHSQLILITHNRETMKRAGVLYGVTMGSDGVSKLLSVKFDEAIVAAQ